MNTYQEFAYSGRRQAMDMIAQYGIDKALDVALRMRGLGCQVGSDNYFLTQYLTILACRCRIEKYE